MREQWTGNVVGRMHIYNIKASELAKACGYTPQYLSMVLSGKKKATSQTKMIIFSSLQDLELEVAHERLHY